MTLTVSDTGIGISEAERTRLFQPFSQADSSTTRRFGGTGLGLSIVRRLAQLMGGEVRVRSQPGKGSAFTVTLLLNAATGEPVDHTPDQSPSLANAVNDYVLVVDDHPVNRQVLVRQLELLGLTADTAVDGADALSLWQPGRYAAVLADMHMPNMDGYALTAAIRGRESSFGALRTPIVAVTANAMRGEEERCLEADMDGYLAKPVALARLSAILGRWVSVTLPPEPPAPAVDRPMLRSWLGNDEATVRSVLVEFLHNARENVRDIKAALAAQDMPAVATAAHKLRGGALSVGAHALQRLAATLEAAGRQGDRAACETVLAPLDRELERAGQDIGA